MPLLYSKYFGIHYGIARTQTFAAARWNTPVEVFTLATRIRLFRPGYTATTRPLSHWSCGSVSSHMNTKSSACISEHSWCTVDFLSCPRYQSQEIVRDQTSGVLWIIRYVGQLQKFTNYLRFKWSFRFGLLIRRNPLVQRWSNHRVCSSETQFIATKPMTYDCFRIKDALLICQIYNLDL